VSAVHRSFLTAAILLALAPASARAEGEPIMPLAQVRQGMQCQAASVVRGTTISTFDVEVLDVVRGDSAAESPRILYRASGPAIDATGIGPGFSGSPIRCPDDAGVVRNIGAVSEGIGEYGGKVGLATPIESILGEPVDPPVGARTDAGMLRSARALATPLTITGVSGPMARLLQRAATKAKRPLFITPGTGLRATPDFPVQPLVPGSAVAVGYTSGAVGIGAVGTVAYVDGDRVWAFGHPLDGVGRRGLLLQDAYVYTVINNPVSSAELSTYKLAVAGHDLGTLSNDANNAVVGRLGALPTRFVMKVVATDLDTKKVRSQETLVTDEAELGLPAGGSALALAATTALGNAAYVTLSGAPARQSGSLCLRVAIRERKKPLRFCNTYVGGGPGPNGAVLADASSAISMLDAFEYGQIHITGVEANLKLRRSFPQAYIVKASAPSVVRRGGNLRVKLTLRRSRGERFTRTISVHVPKGMPTGERRLSLEGTAPDSGGGLDDALAAVIDIGDLSEEDGGESQDPRTVAQLAKAFADLERYDGIRTSFQPLDDRTSPEDELAALLGETGTQDLPKGAEGVAQKPRETYRDPALRIGGSARVRVLVVP
jgi:hypothetical protein